VDVKRPPMSKLPLDVVSGGGVSCAPARLAEASKSAAAPIVSLLRIAILLTYRRNAWPDGAFDPWICWWQTTQDRPMSLLAPVELFSV
jgi:hypothetical protein